MNGFLCGLGVFSVLALTASGCTAGDPGESEDETGQGESALERDLRPNGRHLGIEHHDRPKGNGHAKPGGAAANNGIKYHGGPVMLGKVNLYYIWYGDWAGNTATAILTDLASNIGGSPYWNMNTTYSNGAGMHVSNSVGLGGAINDAYSRGTALSDTDIRTIVSSAITSNQLTKDANGVYFVLTSQDVTATSGFCTSYCGWHSYTAIGGTDIKYAFVGNPARCPSACAEQATGPNGNAGADGMASILVHEAEEATTDPDLNAWYDSRGQENADKCAWTFGATYTVANGAKANVKLGTRDFLIQRNWVNKSGGYCSMSY